MSPDVMLDANVLAIEHSIEKPILLNFINLSIIYCPRWYLTHGQTDLLPRAKLRKSVTLSNS